MRKYCSNLELFKQCADYTPGPPFPADVKSDLTKIGDVFRVAGALLGLTHLADLATIADALANPYTPSEADIQSDLFNRAQYYLVKSDRSEVITVVEGIGITRHRRETLEDPDLMAIDGPGQDARMRYLVSVRDVCLADLGLS